MDLNEWAYITIKNMILQGQYTYSEQIHIEALTKTLQISRTPVREALLRLQVEDLVTVLPHVGYFVRGISRSELHDIYEFRCILECHTAEYAAMTMTEHQIRYLNRIQSRSKQAIKEEDLLSFNEYEMEFHIHLVEHSGNGQITKAMAKVSDFIKRDRAIALSSYEHIRLSCLEHGQILRAIESHSTQKAKNAMKKHIQNVETRLGELISFRGEN